MLKQMSIEELHQRQLEMMIVFDKFCKENNLTYYLAYGTLIGAIRHKGFIPWDDDVDIWMKREDYEKLVTFDQICDTMKIVTKERNQEYYHPYSYCNITDTETVMDEHLSKRPTGKGVFLDIFPLDTLPNDIDKAVSLMKKCKKMVQIQDCCLNVHQFGIKGLVKRIIGKLYNWDKVYSKLQQSAVMYQGIASKHIGVPVFICDTDKGILNSDDFSQVLEWEFEGVKLSVPTGYDSILTRIYGDYMTPPSESMQQGHHMVDYFFKS